MSNQNLSERVWFYNPDAPAPEPEPERDPEEIWEEINGAPRGSEDWKLIPPYDSEQNYEKYTGNEAKLTMTYINEVDWIFLQSPSGSVDNPIPIVPKFHRDSLDIKEDGLPVSWYVKGAFVWVHTANNSYRFPLTEIGALWADHEVSYKIPSPEYCYGGLPLTLDWFDKIVKVNADRTGIEAVPLADDVAKILEEIGETKYNCVDGIVDPSQFHIGEGSWEETLPEILKP